MNENKALEHVVAQLKDINKNLSSISRSLYLISKINAREKEDPYKDMPRLVGSDLVGKFTCYHSEDDCLYFYNNGEFINKIKYDDYIKDCISNGRMYEAELRRADYQLR